MNRTGPRNSITDVAGILVGNAQDDAPEIRRHRDPCRPAGRSRGACDGRRAGNARDRSARAGKHRWRSQCDRAVGRLGLRPRRRQRRSARACARPARALRSGQRIVPIVPAAILFDLVNGGDKDWGRYPPYRELGYEAACNAASATSPSAPQAPAPARWSPGSRAASARHRWCLRTASPSARSWRSTRWARRLVGDGRHFGRRPSRSATNSAASAARTAWPADARNLRIKFRKPAQPANNTTIAAIATDAVLTKAQAKRLAIAAHDGFAHALWPSHTPMDGDLVFRAGDRSSGITPAMDDCDRSFRRGRRRNGTRDRTRGLFRHAGAGRSLPAWSHASSV